MTRDLTHIDKDGNAVMVDVSAKAATERTATAKGSIVMQPETLARISAGGIKKGDVLGVARIAGIMAAKRTHELIPLCHPLALTSVAVDLVADAGRSAVDIVATVKVNGPTGVEMEALTAVSVAALTVYDMCKAIDRGMTISDIRLVQQERRQVGNLRGALMLSVEEAHARIVAAFAPVAPETVNVADALGRVLAEDVVARVSQPPAAVSAMDGYAVRASDVASVPVTLTLIGAAPAGGAYDGTVQAGQCVRIFTGGPLPQGADAIVIQEDVTAERQPDHGARRRSARPLRAARRPRLQGRRSGPQGGPRPGGSRHRPRRGDEPSLAQGSPQAAHRDPCNRRRSGDAGRADRAQPDRVVERHRPRRLRRRMGRHADPARRRAGFGRCSSASRASVPAMPTCS